jgi:hypothetical protein
MTVPQLTKNGSPVWVVLIHAEIVAEELPTGRFESLASR